MDPVTALRAGEVVILPTDTVYGLCALPEHAAQLAELKRRPAYMPIATLYLEPPEALPASILPLLPGPYTFVVGGQGIRVPALAPQVTDVLRVVGPVAATSANLHGRRDPRRLADVPKELREAVAAEVDAGELPGIASTVVNLDAEPPIVLRQGAGLWPVTDD
jgi:tRNA A37 threonylcarbamoyladenosine synthetase subunit TsaC/SUA5/YrdC